MSFNLDDVQVGGTLRVGTGVCPAVKDGDEGINGAVYAEGPVDFGDQQAFPEEQATLMVARTTNQDPDCNPSDRSLWVKGNQRLEGDDGTGKTLEITSGAGMAIDINSGTSWINDSGEAYFTIGSGGMTLSERFKVADQKPYKPFDIQHPTKGEGYRLRYVSLEGPENGVYYRGRLKREKEIYLPNCWKGLVHTNSITVQLQPVGAHQDIIVKRWDDEKIYLQAKGGMPIDCFFHVYGERKDINPLMPEYQGDEYPDPNFDKKCKVPLEDRNFVDPKYNFPRNTITT